MLSHSEISQINCQLVLSVHAHSSTQHQLGASKGKLVKSALPSSPRPGLPGPWVPNAC